MVLSKSRAKEITLYSGIISSHIFCFWYVTKVVLIRVFLCSHASVNIFFCIGGTSLYDFRYAEWDFVFLPSNKVILRFNAEKRRSRVPGYRATL